MTRATHHIRRPWDSQHRRNSPPFWPIWNSILQIAQTFYSSRWPFRRRKTKMTYVRSSNSPNMIWMGTLLQILAIWSVASKDALRSWYIRASRTCLHLSTNVGVLSPLRDSWQMAYSYRRPFKHLFLLDGYTHTTKICSAVSFQLLQGTRLRKYARASSLLDHESFRDDITFDIKASWRSWTSGDLWYVSLSTNSGSIWMIARYGIRKGKNFVVYILWLR